MPSLAPIVWRQPPAHAAEQVELDLTLAAVAATLDTDPVGLLHMPLFEIVSRHAARTPNNLALIDAEQSLDWQTLAARVRRLGRAIADSVPMDGAVAVLLQDGVETMVGVLACAAAARVALVLNINHPASRNATILETAGAAAVVTHDVPSDLELPNGTVVIAPDADTGPGPLPEPLPQDGPWCVIYTSGTTGVPKGITLALGSALHWLCCTLRGFPVGDPTVAHTTMSLFPTAAFAGLHAALSALIAGGCALLPAGASPVPLMLAERPTRMMGLPALVRALMTSPEAREALASIRVLRIGGESGSGSDVANWYTLLPEHAYIQGGYGQTEASITLWQIPRSFAEPGAIPLGVVRPDMQFAILDDDGQPMPDGKAGVLHVRSRHVALGEWLDGRCQEGRMETDPQDPAQRILNTGDVVVIRPDGMLGYKGRADRQIKVRGVRIEPAEIEETLRGVPMVSDAAVVARTQGTDTELLAFILTEHPQAAVVARQHVAGRLPVQMRPRRIIPLAEFPRQPGGKIDQKALLALPETNAEILYYGRATRATSLPAHTGASTKAQQDVAMAWKRVLGVPPIPGLSFLDASGDSLRLLEFVLFLERRVGQRLRLEDFNATATAAEMAMVLDAAVTGALPEPGGRRVFLLPGVSGDMPGLAGLRADCEATAEITLINFPAWREALLGRFEVENIVADAVAQIKAAAGHEPICLIGYSFGANVAFMVAQELEKSGIGVALLVVIDTLTPHLRTGQLHIWSPPSSLREAWWKISALGNPDRLGCLLAHCCTKPAARSALKTVAAWRAIEGISRYGGKLTFWWRHYLQQELRYQMSHRWAKKGFGACPPLRCPILLVRTEANWTDVPEDLGWSTYSDAVEIAFADGNHISMLSSEHRHRVAAAINARLAQALAAHPVADRLAAD